MHINCEECGGTNFTIGRSTWDSAEMQVDESTGEVSERTTNVYATVLSCNGCGTEYVVNRIEGLS